MQTGAIAEQEAFPFFKKDQLTQEAFITLTNNPKELPGEMGAGELRQHVLQGALSNFDALY